MNYQAPISKQDTIINLEYVIKNLHNFDLCILIIQGNERKMLCFKENPDSITFTDQLLWSRFWG